MMMKQALTYLVAFACLGLPSFHETNTVFVQAQGAGDDLNLQCNSEKQALSMCFAKQENAEATVSACTTCVYLAYNAFHIMDSMSCDMIVYNFCGHFQSNNCSNVCPIAPCYTEMTDFFTCTLNRGECTMSCPNGTWAQAAGPGASPSTGGAGSAAPGTVVDTMTTALVAIVSTLGAVMTLL